MLTVSVLYSKMKKFLFNFTFLKVARETQGKQKNFLSLFDSKNFGETNKKCFPLVLIKYQFCPFLENKKEILNKQATLLPSPLFPCQTLWFLETPSWSGSKIGVKLGASKNPRGISSMYVYHKVIIDKNRCREMSPFNATAMQFFEWGGIEKNTNPVLC